MKTFKIVIRRSIVKGYTHQIYKINATTDQEAIEIAKSNNCIPRSYVEHAIETKLFDIKAEEVEFNETNHNNIINNSIK